MKKEEEKKNIERQLNIQNKNETGQQQANTQTNESYATMDKTHR